MRRAHTVTAHAGNEAGRFTSDSERPEARRCLTAWDQRSARPAGPPASPSAGSPGSRILRKPSPQRRERPPLGHRGHRGGLRPGTRNGRRVRIGGCPHTRSRGAGSRPPSTCTVGPARDASGADGTHERRRGGPAQVRRRIRSGTDRARPQRAGAHRPASAGRQRHRPEKVSGRKLRRFAALLGQND